MSIFGNPKNNIPANDKSKKTNPNKSAFEKYGHQGGVPIGKFYEIAKGQQDKTVGHGRHSIPYKPGQKEQFIKSVLPTQKVGIKVEEREVENEIKRLKSLYNTPLIKKGNLYDRSLIDDKIFVLEQTLKKLRSK
ncbi:MAG: hypothetical protein UR46_C0027G0007 [Parcubacteria group bacterium GW2011_GWA1_33_6]|uniref:Uncharacterized protein n=1 Tax=Candidatus Staskawiczbacteria bacterium RIFCSPHIGHO2_02_FULL_33_16 TaxID=1802204 RepID=A0A1G2HUJ5_9BACT|nr:MAG: hypothetical protein UR31_C0001G0024 [Parcubacteria group bacterium GW2011_GWA2_33_14]KKP54249.1 MAG: hypothetical protein UR46_C0027G0007 [Parcubacteria group bacterium GW2011_GWA1_33_6]OGZ66069.1 MAG: hypothetical protein A3D34_02715 [Candidatus Staskawiczbacteria bacterium RIFCSPHIGHO2_02_FULL_33_16]OGZ70820.1 MAG: hypothetical protein A2980_02205 [Candidatus Staskawiczbacteria bacterium RIFCSPLOWO2_01_FULL_33_13]